MAIVRPSSPHIEIGRFLASNRLPFKKSEISPQNMVSLEIAFVATQKDFKILPFAIKGALNCTRSFKIDRILVIVPSDLIEEATSHTQHLATNLEVVDEELYVNQRQIELLKSEFGSRFGWILQQILKLEVVKKSNSSGVLIIDADTVLLRERNWLDSSGKQILTPTWEFHRPYYDFLKSELVIDDYPQHTFVSHHMIMQPKIMRRLRDFLGWENVDDVITSLSGYKRRDSGSPFSIDYELYAQYIFQNSPEKIELLKWSNLNCQQKFRTSTELNSYISKNVDKYGSISFHTY